MCIFIGIVKDGVGRSADVARKASSMTLYDVFLGEDSLSSPQLAELQGKQQ
jgi:hypothetical protein